MQYTCIMDIMSVIVEVHATHNVGGVSLQPFYFGRKHSVRHQPVHFGRKCNMGRGISAFFLRFVPRETDAKNNSQRNQLVNSSLITHYESIVSPISYYQVVILDTHTGI